MATGGENGKIQRLSTFLSSELTNIKQKKENKKQKNIFCTTVSGLKKRLVFEEEKKTYIRHWGRVPAHVPDSTPCPSHRPMWA